MGMLNGLSTAEWLQFDSILQGITGALRTAPKLHLSAGDAMLEAHTATFKALNDMLKSRSSQLVGDMPTYNDYSDGGYDAYGVGCLEDGEDCGGIPSSIIALLAAGCVLVAV